jgi:hypothetical protein
VAGRDEHSKRGRYRLVCIARCLVAAIQWLYRRCTCTCGRERGRRGRCAGRIARTTFAAFALITVSVGSAMQRMVADTIAGESLDELDAQMTGKREDAHGVTDRRRVAHVGQTCTRVQCGQSEAVERDIARAGSVRISCKLGFNMIVWWRYWCGRCSRSFAGGRRVSIGR